MAKLDGIGVWALHVWRSPSGNEHPQWSGPDDLRSCQWCGVRHILARAARDRICPGVAHFEGVRPCVLCGLGWRVPQPAAIAVPDGFLSTNIDVVHSDDISGPPERVYLMDLGAPRPPRCVYCMTLEGKPLELARHRVRDHPQEDQ